MKRTITLLVAIALLGCSLLVSNAWADGHDGWHRSDWGHRDDRGGHWERGWHDGHLGWLWVVGGALLLYNVTHPAPAAQPPVVMSAPTGPGPATTAYWYYCPDSGAYYPYVQTCPGGWQPVAATPPPRH